MKIGISGATGMIGWHMRSYLKQLPEHSVVIADRSTFSNEKRLQDFVSNCDSIIHLAGKNRGLDEEIFETNVSLAERLVSACCDIRANPHIVHSSSIHVNYDSFYGASKRKVGAILREWANGTGATFTNLILPHVFGEGAQPFYNSAVATFAYQLAIRQEPQLIDDKEIELVHGQEVSAEIFRLISLKYNGEVRMQGRRISVSDVLARLQRLSGSYRDDVVPDVRGRLDLQLFNLHRFFLFPSSYPRTLRVNTDDRGSLVEAAKSLNGGQCFFSTTLPGVTRGNHFHYNKVERFLVLQGEATIRVRRLFDDHVHTFHVNGADPAYIDMPTLHTHNITNIGDTELLTLFWANDIYDSEKPDTVFEPV